MAGDKELYAEGNNKFTEKKVRRNSKSIWMGRVVSIVDDLDGRRIKVRIKGLDDKIQDDDLLPFCFPLMPKLLDIMPKEKEAVRVLLTDTQYPYSERLWIGPVLSKYQAYKGEDFINATAGLEDSHVKMDNPITKKVKAKNIAPPIEDVVIHGRGDSDLILGDDNFLLRSNKHKKDKPEEESENPSYIKSVTIEKEDGTNETVMNLLADYVNILTHKGEGNKKVNPFITEGDIENLKEVGEPIVKGNVLASLVKVLIHVSLNHTHPAQGKKAISTSETKVLDTFKTDDMLNRFLKIN